MKRITTISLLIAAAFGSSSALAESIASAWLGTVSVQLIDLDPNDGIAPSITPTGLDSRVSGSVHDSATPITKSYDMYGNAFSAAPSGSVSTSISHSSASITGSDPTNDGNQYVSGSATGPGMLNQYGSFEANSYVLGYFSLSANTQVIFSADSTASASSNAPYHGSVPEAAYASALLYAILFEHDGTTVNSVDDRVISQAYNWGENYNASKSQDKRLSVSVSNLFTEAINGYLYGNVYASGYSYSDYAPSQVPVPAALPLLASALGLFGFARRKAV